MRTRAWVTVTGVDSGAQVGQQGELFPAEALRDPLLEQGFRGPVVCQIVGISYRQLDYWARTHLVEPTLRAAAGSGSQRLYSFTDLVVLKVVKRLLTAGVSLQNIRVAVEHVRTHTGNDLSEVTIFSDGISVYECRGAEEIVDLLQGGQGVFGVALGSAMREVAGEIGQLSAEDTDEHRPPAGIVGLTSRRRARPIRKAG